MKNLTKKKLKIFSVTHNYSIYHFCFKKVIFIFKISYNTRYAYFSDKTIKKLIQTLCFRCVVKKRVQIVLFIFLVT